MDIPPQDSFLYKGKWSPNADDLLLTTALSMKSTDPHWLGTNVPDQVLFEAGAWIERELGCHLTSLRETLPYLQSSCCLPWSTVGLKMEIC